MPGILMLRIRCCRGVSSNHTAGHLRASVQYTAAMLSEFIGALWRQLTPHIPTRQNTGSLLGHALAEVWGEVGEGVFVVAGEGLGASDIAALARMPVLRSRVRLVSGGLT